MKINRSIFAIYAIILFNTGCMWWRDLDIEQEGNAPEIIVEAYETKKWNSVEESIRLAAMNITMSGNQYIAGLYKNEIEHKFVGANKTLEIIPIQLIKKLADMGTISRQKIIPPRKKIIFESKIQKVKDTKNRLVWNIKLKSEKETLIEQTIYIKLSDFEVTIFKK